VKIVGTITEGVMSDHILIEALFAPGCGSRDSTLLMINKLTSEQGVKVDLTETTICSIPEAKTAKFLGSPSIRINGKDIEPESIEKTDYGFG
jgi:hypothetical protein